MVSQIQNGNICTSYANNPYVCASCPQTNVVVPQGTVQLPQTLGQYPQVYAMAQVQPQNGQAVNYNQVAPYINPNSTVFQPSIQVKSGQPIVTANNVALPVENREAQVVYQGPIKTINPQISPVEQIDSKICKDYDNYLKVKTQTNLELKKAMDRVSSHSNDKKSFLAKMMKFAIFALVVIGAYKFRHKLPFIKRLVK